MRRFNPDKELNKIRNGNKNKIIIGLCTLLLIVVVGYSFALYQVRHTNKLVFNTVGEFKKRDIYLSVLVDGEYQNDFPTKEENMLYGGYECDGNATINFDTDKWQVALYASHPDKCTIMFGHKYVDQSGANYPELYQGMIPVYFENGKIYVADITSEWYNYDENKWANAVLIDYQNKKSKFYDDNGNLLGGHEVSEEDILQMYVWIPRYKYQLFNPVINEVIEEQMINIEFESDTLTTGTVNCSVDRLGKQICENDTKGNWFTHPAFTFGNTELKGIWIGKFEPSGELNDFQILPNKTAIAGYNAPLMFNANYNVESNTKYQLDKNEVDTHMIKNREWGAMAYFTQSKYGRCTESGECMEITANDNADYLTGYANTSSEWITENGGKASTTGNMYGIYDASGCNFEFTMSMVINEQGVIANETSEFNEHFSEKYYDKYEYTEEPLDFTILHLGDATRETLKSTTSLGSGWYGDMSQVPNKKAGFWIIRSCAANWGANKGIFAFEDNGIKFNTANFRSVITAEDK